LQTRRRTPARRASARAIHANENPPPHSIPSAKHFAR
jgi:hypothetical protein